MEKQPRNNKKNEIIVKQLARRAVRFLTVQPLAKHGDHFVKPISEIDTKKK